MKKWNLSVILAAFWIVVWVANIVRNLDYYLLPQNRLFLYLCLIILIASLLVFAFLSYKAVGSKLAYKINRKNRCPDCYAKVGNQSFCPNCGKDLSGRELARICPNCGYEELNPKSTSCPKCGKDFFK